MEDKAERVVLELATGGIVDMVIQIQIVSQQTLGS